MNTIRIGVCCLFLSTNLFATKITGKVTNGTTNKPSAGDEVVLLSLAGGMQEGARTQTDSKGEFSLDVSDEGVEHLIRVAHQQVNYFQSAPQGATTAEITVYDSAKQVNNLIAEGRVFRVLSADGQQLQVSEMYVLRNESRPPRTWMSNRTFEVVLPEGAQLADGMAAGPAGMPVTSSPIPTGVSNHYAFVFPIRPGKSQLQVTYKLAYSGSYDFSFSPSLPLAEFGVMLPKGMRFTSTGEGFSPASDESGMTVFVAKSISPGQWLKFSVAGEGVAPREGQGGNTGSGEGNPVAPGGGLGTPIGASEPTGNTRWYILGIVVVVLASGAMWMMWRRAIAARRARLDDEEPRSSSATSRRRPAPSAAQVTVSQGSVLDAVKDELFQLETERLQGKISPPEYEAAKRGLDALLRRQMKKTD